MSEEKKQNRTLAVLKHNFGMPSVMTWGFPLMIMAAVSLLIYLIRCLFKDPDQPLFAGSLVGFSAFMIILTLCALVMPAVICSRNIEGEALAGHYTGIGTLILAFVSGIPLTMIRIPLFNLLSWVTLRISGNSVFPVFFHSDPVTPYGKALSVLCGTVIPAFGAALFFFGLLWSRFRSTDRHQAYIAITLAFMLFSMDYTSLLASCAAAVWCCYLRSRIHNIWAPFLCLISSDLFTLFLPESLSKIDLFAVQTHADIGATYFYSSFPSFFMGMVLLLFFIRVLDQFSHAVRHEVTGSEYDDTIPPFARSINLSLILTGTLFIILWVLILKGAHL